MNTNESEQGQNTDPALVDTNENAHIDEKKELQVEHLEDGEKESDSDVDTRAAGMSKEMYEATHGDARIPTWSKGYIKLYIICSLLYLFSSHSGYDGSLLSSINAQQKFRDTYGITANTDTGLLFSISSIASICAAAFVWLADVIGRRPTIFVSLITTAGAVVMVAMSDTLPFLIGARFALFFFTALGYTASIPYLVEISPPHLRGSLAGLFNTFFYCGSTIASLACYGSKLQHGDTEKAFRIPFWCQMIAPGIIFIGAILCPESPRWLLSKGKEEQAREIMRKYHANGQADHPIIDAQVAEIKAELAMSPIKKFSDYFNVFDLFNTRSKRYRMFLTITWSFFGNFTGSQVVTYYLPDMLNSLGVESEDTKILLNAVYAIVGWIFATTGALLQDVAGRRKMLLISTGGIVICFAVIFISAACYSYIGNRASSVVSILFIYIFGGIFAFSYTCLQPIYGAEVATNAMRARAVAFYQLVFNLSGFILGFCGSMAMEAMSHFFYLFFLLWNSFTFCIIYFFYVETKGRTLEEMDSVFAARNPRKASLQVRKRHDVADA